MPTIAEQLINQGKQEGREKGIEEGTEEGIVIKSREGILDILETRFTYIPPEIQSRLNLIDDAVSLKRLHKLSITVGSNEEFLGLLEDI